MERKCKPISGQIEFKSIVKNASRHFSDSEKHAIIGDYLKSNATKQQIWQKHTGQIREHGQIVNWMRQLGYPESTISRNRTFIFSNDLMNENIKDPNDKDLELLELKHKIALLEAKLKEEEVKAFAFSTMIDIAEEQLNISIRKKFDAKP